MGDRAGLEEALLEFRRARGGVRVELEYRCDVCVKFNRDCRRTSGRKISHSERTMIYMMMKEKDQLKEEGQIKELDKSYDLYKCGCCKGEERCTYDIAAKNHLAAVVKYNSWLATQAQKASQSAASLPNHTIPASVALHINTQFQAPPVGSLPDMEDPKEYSFDSAFEAGDSGAASVAGPSRGWFASSTPMFRAPSTPADSAKSAPISIPPNRLSTPSWSPVTPNTSRSNNSSSYGGSPFASTPPQSLDALGIYTESLTNRPRAASEARSESSPQLTAAFERASLSRHGSLSKSRPMSPSPYAPRQAVRRPSQLSIPLHPSEQSPSSRNSYATPAQVAFLAPLPKLIFRTEPLFGHTRGSPSPFFLSPSPNHAPTVADEVHDGRLLGRLPWGLQYESYFMAGVEANQALVAYSSNTSWEMGKMPPDVEGQIWMFLFNFFSKLPSNLRPTPPYDTNIPNLLFGPCAMRICPLQGLFSEIFRSMYNDDSQPLNSTPEVDMQVAAAYIRLGRIADALCQVNVKPSVVHAGFLWEVAEAAFDKRDLQVPSAELFAFFINHTSDSFKKIFASLKEITKPGRFDTLTRA